MELFARLSCSFPAGHQHIENDDEINRILNEKLVIFLRKNSVTEYRILNGGISSLPSPAFAPGTESVMCDLNIAYKIK